MSEKEKSESKFTFIGPSFHPRPKYSLPPAALFIMSSLYFALKASQVEVEYFSHLRQIETQKGNCTNFAFTNWEMIGSSDIQVFLEKNQILPEFGEVLAEN